MTTRDPVHPSVTVAGITDDDIRVHAVAARTASDDFGTVAVRVGYGLDLYLTTAGANALCDRLADVLDGMPDGWVVVDSDRNVRVQVVTR